MHFISFVAQEEIIDETDRYADNSYARKVLIRDADGNLVRANTRTSRKVQVPGGNTALVLSEVDTATSRDWRGGGDAGKFRPDIKRTPTKNKPKVGTNSPTQLLLGNPYTADTDPEISQSDIERGLRESPVAANAMSCMQYAQIPSLSSSSVLLPEVDKNMLGGGTTSPNVSSFFASAATESGSADVPFKKLGTVGRGMSESRSQLQLRPLPEDMSSERGKKLPNRQQKGTIKRTPEAPTAHSMRSYGSTSRSSQTEMNADERAPALDDASMA